MVIIYILLINCILSCGKLCKKELAYVKKCDIFSVSTLQTPLIRLRELFLFYRLMSSEISLHYPLLA
jgi:hypothetical protein